ncbi:MAG: peptidylprolyl isomerase [Clostridium sp.]|nr:peptidylprolyl isomerase [Clostridium sp.]
MKTFKSIAILICAAAATLSASAQNNVAEEVAWMIGDEPIYKSEIEDAYQEIQQNRTPINGDPYCVIPEMLAVQRLYLHQAELDTIEAPMSMVHMQVDSRINMMTQELGGREKLELYFGMPLPQIRERMTKQMIDMSRIQRVQEELTKDVKATPNDVRKYFNTLEDDSIPFVPLMVEGQMIVINPSIPRQEIDDVKSRLRDISDRINRGDIDFTTAANFYSEDQANQHIHGGELGFMGRGQLVPEYAAVAFNLNDPKKVSKIVETEYGFHIIQLIEKRGDRINTRHILMRPKVAEKDLVTAINRLDSVRKDILDNKLTFDEAVRYYSQDKDTRFSRGVMINDNTSSTRFEMKELPTEIARRIAELQPGEISEPFIMMDPKHSREQVVMVKLTNRIAPHRANLSDDYEMILSMYENNKKQKILEDWLEKKIKDTYVRIEDGWRGCEFEHKGWIK